MALTRITKGVIKPNENYDTHNINSTGIVTAIGLDVNGNGDISGNLNVGGVLTYEDVTSIDSVGIITAQKDIHVGAGVSVVGVGTFGGGIKVGTGITIGPAGVGTFTSVHAIDSFACQKYPTTKISFPTNNNHLQIFTSNTQRMRFYAAGTIFIGEEAQGPSGNASLYLNTSSTSVFSDSSRLYDQPNKAMVHIKNYNATGGGEAGIVLHNDNGAAGVVAIYGKKTSNYISDCIFRLRDGGSTSVESFRVRTTDIQVGTGVTIETNGQAEIAGITTFYKDVHIKTSTGRLYVGATDRISLMADPSHSYLRINGGHFQIHNNNFGVRSYDGNGSITLIYAPVNDGSGSGGVQLYHYNGSGINPRRFLTTNQGIEVLGHSELDNVNIAGIVTVTNTSSGIGLKLIDASSKQFFAGGGGGGTPFAGSFTGHDFRIQVGGLQNAIFKYASGATGNLELGPSSGIGITFNGATGNAGYAGIITATKFVGDGSGLTNLPGGGSYGNNDVDSHLNVSGASSGQILSWNGSDYAWVSDQTGGGGGSTTFTGLTDTPANFTSQAGKYLRVNAGATALEYVTLPVDPDTNTTYSQSSVADGSNVKLRLTDSGSTNDDILITAGNNITISSVTAGGFTIASTASGGATVTTDDSAPGSPSDGDLWWKSDEGRLKVYYADGSSNQWVDASPPAEPPATIGGTMSAHIIPDTNAAYDLGNAEYKIRHLFLSDNTVYFQGDFLKVAQHNSGGSAQSASYLIPLAKLKDALNASSNFDQFKSAILAITDAT